MSRSITLFLVATVASATSITWGATPIVVPAAGGEVALPTSGLAVSLPPRDGITCNVTGQWTLTEGETAFEGRDIIDEIDGEGNLNAGTRILIGDFSADEAPAIVRGVRLADAWEDTIELWGAEWHVRGGTYMFTSDLGVKPAVVLATSPVEGKRSLLLHHFLIAAGSAVSKEVMLSQVKGSPTLAAVFRAYCADQYAPVQPTKSEAVMQPAISAIARVVQLPRTGLNVRLPDDGFVWVSEAQPDDATDMLFLMAPRLPKITVELLLVDAPDARAAFAQLGLEDNPWDPAPANLPPGWQSGVTVTTSDNAKQATVCTVIGQQVLLVGFLATPRVQDIAPYRLLLEALAEAVRHPEPLPGTLASR
jgi:hypothetical protein